jgi:hypothetical protein
MAVSAKMSARSFLTTRPRSQPGHVVKLRPGRFSDLVPGTRSMGEAAGNLCFLLGGNPIASYQEILLVDLHHLAGDPNIPALAGDRGIQERASRAGGIPAMKKAKLSVLYGPKHFTGTRLERLSAPDINRLESDEPLSERERKRIVRAMMTPEERAAEDRFRRMPMAEFRAGIKAILAANPPPPKTAKQPSTLTDEQRALIRAIVAANPPESLKG